MKISALHENFISSARQPMSFDKLPIMPRGADVPVIAVNKWNKANGKLTKIYKFMTKESRNYFVREVLDHEVEVGHTPILLVDGNNVTMTLQTRDVEKISELDKEFAKWSDELYRDSVYYSSDDKSV